MLDIAPDAHSTKFEVDKGRIVLLGRIFAIQDEPVWPKFRRLIVHAVVIRLRLSGNVKRNLVATFVRRLIALQFPEQGSKSLARIL